MWLVDSGSIAGPMHGHHAQRPARARAPAARRSCGRRAARRRVCTVCSSRLSEALHLALALPGRAPGLAHQAAGKLGGAADKLGPDAVDQRQPLLKLDLRPRPGGARRRGHCLGHVLAAKRKHRQDIVGIRRGAAHKLAPRLLRQVEPLAAQAAARYQVAARPRRSLLALALGALLGRAARGAALASPRAADSVPGVGASVHRGSVAGPARPLINRRCRALRVGHEVGGEAFLELVAGLLVPLARAARGRAPWSAGRSGSR